MEFHCVRLGEYFRRKGVENFDLWCIAAAAARSPIVEILHSISILESWGLIFRDFVDGVRWGEFVDDDLIWPLA